MRLNSQQKFRQKKLKRARRLQIQRNVHWIQVMFRSLQTTNVEGMFDVHDALRSMSPTRDQMLGSHITQVPVGVDRETKYAVNDI